MFFRHIKNTQKVLDTIQKYEYVYDHLIWITVAGRCKRIKRCRGGK